MVVWVYYNTIPIYLIFYVLKGNYKVSFRERITVAGVKDRIGKRGRVVKQKLT